jgi:uncharacterized membrane protein YhhN
LVENGAEGGSALESISLLAFWTFAAVDWVAVAQERRRLEHVAKPAALAALLICAASSPDPKPWLIAALALSLLGDVYLMLPDDRFIAGLSAFLLGHVAYVVAFASPAGAVLVWLAVVLVATSPFAVRILRGVPSGGALRPAVVLYMLVIAAMVASAVASGRWIAALGAVLFLCSDTMIAWSRFVSPFPAAPVAIIVTYHLGQWGLVESLIR